jgi:hypothetical protein
VKQPRPRGSAVDAKRLREWLDHFRGYRHGVGELSIQNWIAQFDSGDQDLAARVLDAVEFYGTDRISAAFRESLNAIPGWHAKPSQRKGEWRFIPYSASSGTSADGMIYQFRLANDLDARKWNAMFIRPSEIVKQQFGPDDTIVFVDDLVATGNQVVEAWSETFAELVAEVGRVFLIVVAAVREARRKISDETEIRVVSSHNLAGRDNLFADECTCFTPADKDALLRYGKKADEDRPRGYGDCGLVVVFQHRCPNNTVPILHARNGHWDGLFQRHG